MCWDIGEGEGEIGVVGDKCVNFSLKCLEEVQMICHLLVLLSGVILEYLYFFCLM